MDILHTLRLRREERVSRLHELQKQLKSVTPESDDYKYLVSGTTALNLEIASIQLKSPSWCFQELVC